MDVCVGKDVYTVELVAKDVTLQEFVRSKVNDGGREDHEDPFYVVDLGRLLELYHGWREALPSVSPFYAVKCNDDPALLKTLAALGTGFDCASKNEIRAVLGLGVTPERIIYANPCKQVSHIKYAAKKGVQLMTFDNELELHKVKAHFPTARLVLRIRADDPAAICQLGIKFGCSVADGYQLLSTARDLGLEVVGVSFHVGSGCQTPSAYQEALEMAANIFQYAETLDCHLTLLDIGGGFPGTKDSQELFGRVTGAISRGLEKHFSSLPGVKVIAEPGRYFACSTHTLAVNIISKRMVEEESSQSFMYYVSDGVYGSFNCILYDHVTPTPALLEDHAPSSPLYNTSLWGPTCDGLDKICDVVMPELAVGDWLYFDDMGAYTVSAFSSFNGFLRPKIYYCVSETNCESFQQLHHTPTSNDTSTSSSSYTSPEQLPTVNSLPPLKSPIQELVEAY